MRDSFDDYVRNLEKRCDAVAPLDLQTRRAQDCLLRDVLNGPPDSVEREAEGYVRQPTDSPADCTAMEAAELRAFRFGKRVGRAEMRQELQPPPADAARERRRTYWALAALLAGAFIAGLLIGPMLPHLATW
jgi:ferric-dicitrate binding protein FerR (iron transport regulator)